jgi:hypothetical protein
MSNSSSEIVEIDSVVQQRDHATRGRCRHVSDIKQSTPFSRTWTVMHARIPVPRPRWPGDGRGLESERLTSTSPLHRQNAACGSAG